HKLEEVFALADRITVLRDGSTIWTKAAGETNKADVIRAMVGREITDLFPRRVGATRSSASLAHTAHERVAPALRVANLTVADPHTGRLRLHDISFSVARGEVVGLGGLMGAGRTELVSHLFGAWGERRAGRVELGGEELPALRPAEVLRRGVALVSEDR